MTETNFQGLRIRTEREDVVARWGCRAIISRGYFEIPRGRRFFEGEFASDEVRETIDGLLFANTSDGAEEAGLLEHLDDQVVAGRFDFEPKAVGLIIGPGYTFYWEADTCISGGYLYVGCALVAETVEVSP